MSIITITSICFSQKVIKNCHYGLHCMYGYSMGLKPLFVSENGENETFTEKRKEIPLLIVKTRTQPSKNILRLQRRKVEACKCVFLHISCYLSHSLFFFFSFFFSTCRWKQHGSSPETRESS